MSNPDRDPMRQDDPMAESRGQAVLRVLKVLGVVQLRAGVEGHRVEYHRGSPPTEMGRLIRGLWTRIQVRTMRPFHPAGRHPWECSMRPNPFQRLLAAGGLKLSGAKKWRGVDA